MTTNNFRTIAMALRDHVSDTYALLAAADAVEKILPDLTLPSTPMEFTHESLVSRALGDAELIGYMQNSQKINAIKRLRLLTNCGLKAAKDAVEDTRVMQFHGGY